MSKKRFVPKNFSKDALLTIGLASDILEEYAAAGFTLTLRQLYYQFVARGYIQNKVEEYKKLGKTMGDARLAGMVDWDHMEDRTRNLRSLQHFAGAEDALQKLHSWYHVDMWQRQRHRPVVFIEKDALVGVIEGVCDENDVPYFSCRGYTSLSEVYVASQRFRRYLEAGQTPYIIHFGDHDPSGIDMSRDIVDRLTKTFMTDCEFKRVALNMDQVEEHEPPPNPAKVNDPRFKAYLAEYGDESWELDALDPPVFRAIIEREVASIRDQRVWDEDAEAKRSVKAKLLEIAQDWESVASNKKRIAKLEADNRRVERELAATTEALAKLRKRKRKKGGDADAEAGEQQTEAGAGKEVAERSVYQRC